MKYRNLIFFTSLLFLLSNNSALLADVLGSFDHVRNVPGFLELNPRSPLYKGNVDKKYFRKSVENRTPSELLADYLTKDKKFHLQQADTFLAEVESYKKNAFLAYCSQKLPEKFDENHLVCKTLNPDARDSENKQLNKFYGKWSRNRSKLVADFSKQEMLRAKELSKDADFRNLNRPENQNFFEALFNALEAFSGLQGEDAQWGKATSKILYYKDLGVSFLKIHQIRKDRLEAANLVVPESMKEDISNQMFLSPDQVKNLEDKGFDTGTLDPLDSGFWRKPKMHPDAWNPYTYSRQGVNSLKVRHSDEEVEAMLDPDKEISMVFAESDLTRGESPKLRGVYGDGQEWKIKFLTDRGGTHPLLNPISEIERIILASEVNVEPAVNNIAAAIGFTIDPTYYKKRLRLYMPERVYKEGVFDKYLEEEIVFKLEKHFKAAHNIRSAFRNILEDEHGRKYVLFKGVSLEKKSDEKTDQNISISVRHNFGKTLKREHRAFALFLAIVMDPDTKDDNTRLKIVPKTDGSGFQLAISAADMGIAFGFGYPNEYNRDMVKELERTEGEISAISLTYRNFFYSPVFDSMSFADARWLLRYIAQINRETLLEIFLSAGYPEVVANYYREIFLRRCDQLYSVLGMVGKTYEGIDGRPFTIEKKSQLINTKNYTVPGFETFFKEGRLHDPDNKLFDKDKEFFERDWGTDNFFKEEAGRPKAALARIVQHGLAINGMNTLQNILLANFQWTNISMNPFCKRNNCFYSGPKVGIDWFIPMRFVFHNPTASKGEYPYWVVDMFRLAIALGYGSNAIFAKLGLALSEATLGLGAEFVKGYDFIKITPVKDYSTAVTTLKEDLTKVGKLSFNKSIIEQISRSMKDGDVLIHSSYIGARGSMFLSPTQMTTTGVLISGLEVGAETYYTNRTYLMKGHDDKFLANWADIKRLNIFSSLFVQILFSRFPFLRSEYKLRNEKNQVYMFDSKIPEEEAALHSHIGDTHPDKIPEPYRFESKFSKYRGGELEFGFFGLRKLNLGEGQTEVVGSDFHSGAKVHEIAYEKTNKFHVFKKLEFFDQNFLNIKAQMDQDGDLFAKMDFKYYQNQIYRDEFKDIFGKYQEIFPKDFLLFDPSSVKEYIGKFNINSKVIFGPEALDELFITKNYTKLDLCSAFANTHEIADPHTWCTDLFSWKPALEKTKSRARTFLQKYEEAKKFYSKKESLNLSTEENKKHSFKTLQRIVYLLNENKDGIRIVDVLKSLLTPEHIYRDVKMTSFLDGFPGQTEEIATSPDSMGKLKPIPRYLANDVDDVFLIFTDEIDRVLDSNNREILDRSSIRR